MLSLNGVEVPRGVPVIWGPTVIFELVLYNVEDFGLHLAPFGGANLQLLSNQYKHRLDTFYPQDVGAAIDNWIRLQICVNHLVNAVPRYIGKPDRDIARPILRLLRVSFNSAQFLIWFGSRKAGVNNRHAPWKRILAVDGAHTWAIGATEGLSFVDHHLVPSARVLAHIQRFDRLAKDLVRAGGRCECLQVPDAEEHNA